MNRRWSTALMLNLFVLPGVGHWYLGHRCLGGCFAAWAMIAMLYPLLRYARALRAAMEAMASASAGPALAGAFANLHRAWLAESWVIVLGCVAVVLCWVVAVVDLFRLRGRGDGA